MHSYEKQIDLKTETEIGNNTKVNRCLDGKGNNVGKKKASADGLNNSVGCSWRKCNVHMNEERHTDGGEVKI